MTKDELIDKYRDINVDHMAWWDYTYDSFKEAMEDKGIRVTRMYFSGFWSQGDGACFEGYVADWPLFLQSLGYDSPVLAQHAKDCWHFSVSHSGHYYHEYSTTFGDDIPNPDGETDEWFIERYSPYPLGDFRSTAWLAVLRSFDYNKLVDEFTDAFRSHMRDLYSQLEDVYDHLTSDEVVWEALEANDMTEETEENEE